MWKTVMLRALRSSRFEIVNNNVEPGAPKDSLHGNSRWNIYSKSSEAVYVDLSVCAKVFFGTLISNQHEVKPNALKAKCNGCYATLIS